MTIVASVFGITKKAIHIFLIFMTSFVFGQDDFFSTVGASKKKILNEKSTYYITADWRHIYNDEKWDRLGSGFEINYKFNIFTFEGGNILQYTFDKKISNFFELRPWVGIKLENKIIDDFFLIQEAKVEWRNFFYSELKDENYIRSIVDLGLSYNLRSVNLPNWLVQGNYIRYFLKDPSLGERFANSRELAFTIRKIGKNSFSISYKNEKYRKFLEEQGNAKAHSIELRLFF